MPRKPHKSKAGFGRDSERVNEQIRIPKVMVIDEKGQNLGEMPNEEAKRLAREAKMDLVEVAPNTRPPVCRIMDYGKFKYEKGQKEKKQRSNSKTNKTKVIRLSPNIGDHDVDTKVKSVERFLRSGDKVLLQLQYKGRAKAHKGIGFDIVERIAERVSDLGTSQKPRLQGAILSCMIEPTR